MDLLSHYVGVVRRLIELENGSHAIDRSGSPTPYLYS